MFEALTLPDAPVTLSVLFRRNEVWIKDTELYEPEPEQQQVEREQQEEEEEEVDPVPEEEAPVDPVPEEVAPVDPVPEEEAPVDPIPEPGEDCTQSSKDMVIEEHAAVLNIPQHSVHK